MKIKKTLLIGLCMIPFLGSAQTVSNPIIDAVLKTYAEELEKTPTDFNLLFARANQYFLMGEYLKALDDLSLAIKYTSLEDRKVLFDEYLLRAEIYEIRNENDNALRDLTEANRILPNTVSCLYKLANLNYKMGKYDEARKNYEHILRIDPLSYQTMNGLARVAVKQNNIGLAREYSDRAVSLYPAQANVFVNRAQIFNMIGEPDAAARDLLSAISLDYEKSTALDDLMAMGKTNYHSVVAALNSAINVAPDSGILIYLRGVLFFDYGNYSKALVDFNHLINGKIFTSDIVYSYCAETLFNLGKYPQALTNINKSITENPSDYNSFILQSKILLELERSADAMEVVQMVLNVAPDDINALTQKAILLALQNKSTEALQAINTALLNNPENTKSLMVRGWIQNALFKDETAANKDYRRIEEITLNDSDNMEHIFALHLLGRNAEAKLIMEHIIDSTNVGAGKNLYDAAVLYAQCGDNETALNYLDGALVNGYGSYYNIVNKKDGFMTLAPLRGLPKFKELIAKYKTNFE